MIPNPAWQAWLAMVNPETVWAQVLVRRIEKGFEVRQVADRDVADAKLQPLNTGEMHAVAQYTFSGAFRPLSTAPNLRTGWRWVTTNETELEQMLGWLYPGSVADWYASQSPQAAVTHFREFTSRQTGMYRIASMLEDGPAALAVRACCHARVCLKRRLWTVPGLAPDAAEGKSLIPCLEPCAVMLEFARKAMRLEQDEKTVFAFASDDLATVKAALQRALDHPDPGVREGDTNEPGNPRRMLLALEKLNSLPAAKRIESF